MPAQEHVCPWWAGYLLASPIRRIFQNPDAMLAPYVRPGMAVLEPGPGMGFFTLPLSRMVGAKGCVYAIDMQKQMLDGLMRRATKAGLADRVRPRLVAAESMALDDLSGRIDLVCALLMVHEMPSAERFFAECAAALKPGGRVLLGEPRGHVTAAKFQDELDCATRSGLRIIDQPKLGGLKSALLGKE